MIDYIHPKLINETALRLGKEPEQVEKEIKSYFKTLAKAFTDPTYFQYEIPFGMIKLNLSRCRNLKDKKAIELYAKWNGTPKGLRNGKGYSARKRKSNKDSSPKGNESK